MNESKTETNETLVGDDRNNDIKAKIVFVSNTYGTTVAEVLIVVLLPLLTYSIHCLLFHSLRATNWKQKSLEFIINNVILVLPFVLGLTVLSDHLLLIDSALLVLLITILLWKSEGRLAACARTMNNYDGDTNYISTYKAIIQMTTCFCILAVDFNVFPRRFAKAEVYGIGCMDLGVGTFVFSMALTSPCVRGRQRIVLNYLFRTINSSFVLIVLGLIRVAVIKMSHYQEHITEYGIHWNFFLTLAVVRILGVFILYILPWFRRQFGYFLLAILIMFTYQFALSKGGLEEMIQHGLTGDDARISFLDANREGIISCIGYLGLYFMGMFLGAQLFKFHFTPVNKILWLLLWCVMGYIGLHLSTSYLTPISRQMVNLSYFLLQLVTNALMLSFLLFCQILVKSIEVLNKKEDRIDNVIRTVPTFYARISKRQLVYFLMGNVFTGVVNKMVNTLEISNGYAVLFLVIYMMVLNLSISMVG